MNDRKNQIDNSRKPIYRKNDESQGFLAKSGSIWALGGASFPLDQTAVHRKTKIHFSLALRGLRLSNFPLFRITSE